MLWASVHTALLQSTHPATQRSSSTGGSWKDNRQAILAGARVAQLEKHEWIKTAMDVNECGGERDSDMHKLVQVHKGRRMHSMCTANNAHTHTPAANLVGKNWMKIRTQMNAVGILESNNLLLLPSCYAYTYVKLGIWTDGSIFQLQFGGAATSALTSERFSRFIQI